MLGTGMCLQLSFNAVKNPHPTLKALCNMSLSQLQTEAAHLCGSALTSSNLFHVTITFAES